MDEKKVELLSPAGSLETLKAVAVAGADAVYAAGKRFGARAYAGNLELDELRKAIDYLHLHGKRLYLTVNTMLKEEELKGELYDFILPLYRQGLDGVIFQDLGVLRFLRFHFPDMEYHASTQMFITGPYGAGLLKDMGCSRIVAARELSLQEIKEIHDSIEIEIEGFIHGALCYCYSGQCLLSSMIGGRSGNRGRCAQPCRLPYQVKGSLAAYPLSMKDLCAIDLLPELVGCGMNSLKIEGRMKQMEYAAGVTSIYREYLDRCLLYPKEAYRVLGKDKERLLDLGNRSGFTKGYYFSQNGPDMMAMERPSHTKTHDELQKEIRGRFKDREIQEKIKGFFVLSKGFPARLTLQCRERSVTVEGETVQAAKSCPMDVSVAYGQMKKTGASGFVFEALDIQMEEGVFLPVGAINRLRRNGLEALRNEMLKGYRRTMANEPKGAPAKAPRRDGNSGQEAGLKPYLAVSAQTQKQGTFLLEYPFIDRIYLDSGAFPKKEEARQVLDFAKAAHQAGKIFFYRMPLVLRGFQDPWYKQQISVLQEAGVDGFLAGNLETIGLLSEAGVPGEKILADSGLYVWSSLGKKEWETLGIKHVTLPLEANGRELLQRGYDGGEMILYGYLPLMVSAQCIVKNTKGCEKKPQLTMLKDRYQKSFPVWNQCRDCYNILYNSSPLSLLHQQKIVSELKPSGHRLSFTIESGEQIKQILSYYEQAFLKKKPIDRSHYLKEFTNGHLKRGVE